MLIHYHRLASMFIMLFFLVSCEKSEIQGEVKDPFGNGIGGVSIQIEKSKFKSVTDSQGKYSVDYVPGAFRVNITKLGFTTHHIDLNLQEKSAFPAETIVMYPIPQEPGIYYLGQKNLVKITGGTIQATKAEGNWMSYRWTYSSPFYGSLTIPEGVANFIDTVPKPLALSSMNNLVLYEGLLSMIEKKDFQNGFSIMQTSKPKAEKIGDEKLQLWTFELKGGQYAFTEYYYLNGLPAPNKEIPSEGENVFPFQVSSDATSSSTTAQNPAIPPGKTKENEQVEDESDCNECRGGKAQEEKLRAEATKDQVESNVVTLGSTYVTESFSLDKPEAKTIVERKVIAKDNERITIAATNINSQSQKPRILEFTMDWNLLSSRNPSGSGSNFAPPIKYFDFPLYPGKKWQEKTTETNTKTGAIKQHVISATVGAWETVTVPARTFQGIKITLETELIDSTTGEKTTGTDISWYVPKVGRSVKSITSSRNAEEKEQQQIIQLIRYKTMLENQA